MQERPKSEYERIRDWLLETELADQISGRVLEYSWHSKPFIPLFYVLFSKLTYQFAKSSCKCLRSIVNLPGNVFAKLLGCATSHAQRVVAIRDINFLSSPRYHRVGLRRDRVRTDGLHLVGVIDLQDGREKPVCRTQYFTLRTQDLLKMRSTRRVPFGAKFPPPNLQDIHQEGVRVQPHIDGNPSDILAK